ncbi:MAG: glycine cleavage system protein GcvH [Phycisphaerae bacterium]|nr:glycine cleavage system protein GcvH [Phycisphaerae bacterium]
MMIDADAGYLESHEWAKKQDGNVFTVGLTAYAIEQLGDIVYMELPEAGTEVIAGEPFGVVESVKSASDMYAPISGTVVEANTDIPDNPDILKGDAYDAGWLIKIEASDPDEFEDLMDNAAYKKFLETEA